jgi:3-deoxy-D-manno-octulosonate 8-phosphate phosphatase (KDO 8-P phosphatase)
MSVPDKKKLVADYMTTHNLQKEEILYMADDLPDLPVMKIVGLPSCPADAVPEIREVVLYISPLKGGFACVRDVIEKVLKLHDHWHYREDVTSK